MGQNISLFIINNDPRTLSRLYLKTYVSMVVLLKFSIDISHNKV